jgi:hypothetical protein
MLTRSRGMPVANSRQEYSSIIRAKLPISRLSPMNPFGDRLDRVVGWPSGERGLDHLCDDDVAVFDDRRGRCGFAQTRAPWNSRS